MAQIAVEKKSSMNWLWLLLAALLVGLLLWFLFARNTGETQRNRMAEPIAAGDTGAITSLSAITAAAEPQTYDGRRVELNEPVRVNSVTGDKTFWVTSANTGGQVLVFLDEQPTPNQPATEGRYDINPGQMLTITGYVRSFPGFDQIQQQWNADSRYRSEYENQKVYIHADRVNIQYRP